MDPRTILVNVLQRVQVLIGLGEKTKLQRTNSQTFVACLKPLKPFLEEVRDAKVTWTEAAIDSVELLERALEDCTNLIERCCGKGSKVYMILRSYQIITVFQNITFETEQALNTLRLGLLHLSDHSRIQAERCLQELKRARYMVDISDERFSEEIEALMRDQREGQRTSLERLQRLFDKVDIRSNDALFREVDALEKEKEHARLAKDKMEEDYIDRVISLLSKMLEVKGENKNSQTDVRGISIPPDFRCPLSLELMADPVIVASGQTYERAYIQQWLDQGNTTCPKTRQILAHTNLIPNYTVKALITNWCEANDVPLPEPAKLRTHVSLPPSEPVPSKLASKEEVLTSQDASETRDSFACATDTSALSSRPPSTMSNTKLKASGLADHDNGVATLSSVGEEEGPSQVFTGSHNRAHAKSCDGSQLLERESGHNCVTSVPSDSSHLEGMREHVPRESNVEKVAQSLSGSSPCHGELSGELERMIAAAARSHAHSEKYGLQARSQEKNYDSQRKESTEQTKSLAVQPTQGPDSSFLPNGNVHAVIEGFVKDLHSSSEEIQRNAAAELRLLAKYNMENRILISYAGAIQPLVTLLTSTDLQTQENAVTALLNLSINDNNKSEIAAAGAIDPLVTVLEVGTSEAKENAAATLFSLSVMDENKVLIGASGAIPPLVQLLINGTPRGKKDAATALFNLSIFHENKGKIVRAGAVRPLVKLMTEPAAGMVDKAVAVLANLATISEGRVSIGEEGGIPALVEVVEAGSQRGKENAAAALLHLCTSSSRHRAMVLQEDVIPPLHVLSQSGTARAKEKASALLRHFREQRHGSFGGRNGHMERKNS
ncbi:hypothetical protein O6H91_07G123800 [Diphasiastrum complanatum]|uniref:Uncharacterized protein n=2 Tax=Diphasiastrum complanatum TaxID=34168 RepID=A0ACC2D9M6_DIPCM|nr:hypothetical protein O6H91_Y370400 [Diphasiastrum complanatum]KAJ7298900.1 hypothetical protein O6H91_Y370400 [Diphasiastrum complanatum]KAJ7298901.1 hypothetical protein O6H91_Y370400 [Diphasiastrum complanatum]KAJ7298902.1 hypothetical protein O6H91_Y370400 [Diphasiastrum complanatum]KAJ7298904.1 hypothetical protein O6H91_Y370400 [Diphasiastrum complanatum]